jgi:hypothetical protein
MKIRFSLAAVGLLAVASAFLIWSQPPGIMFGIAAGIDPLLLRESAGKGDFEVWIADQSDTRPGFGGQLLIYEGSDLMGLEPARATPVARLDLAGATADLLLSKSGMSDSHGVAAISQKQYLGCSIVTPTLRRSSRWRRGNG